MKGKKNKRKGRMGNDHPYAPFPFVELETLFSIFNFTKDYTNIYK